MRDLYEKIETVAEEICTSDGLDWDTLKPAEKDHYYYRAVEQYMARRAGAAEVHRADCDWDSATSPPTR